MTRRTQTREMRDWFGKKDGKRYDALPLEKKLCKVCMNEMLVADSSVANFHRCCRRYRNNSRSAINHIEECHNPEEPMKVFEKLLELNKQKQNA